jgi:hypothetical protein
MASGLITELNYENGAFAKCVNMSLNMPYHEALTNIGEFCFSKTHISTFDTSRTNISTIGTHAFADTPFLKKGFIEAKLPSLGSFAFANSAIEYVRSRFMRQDNSLVFATDSKIESIPEGCFSNCKELKEVQLPNSVTTIEKSAFHGCESLTKITGKSINKVE